MLQAVLLPGVDVAAHGAEGLGPGDSTEAPADLLLELDHSGSRSAWLLSGETRASDQYRVTSWRWSSKRRSRLNASRSAVPGECLSGRVAKPRLMSLVYRERSSMSS